MDILVCVKQVPGTSKVEVDEKTGVLKRDGVESKMNPYDLYAVEAALRIRSKTGGKVTAVTMGPPQSQAIIREAYAMGVDAGYLISDRKFAGADVLATAFALSQGIRAIGRFDLIICGKQTTDGDTAQVGPELAEFLNIPHVAWVKSIDDVDDRHIVVAQDLADSVEVVELTYPCLITVEKGICQPRLPSYRLKIASRDRPIGELGLKDFADRDELKYGLRGSPTQVEAIFPPHSDTHRELLDGAPEELAERLHSILKTGKFL